MFYVNSVNYDCFSCIKYSTVNFDISSLTRYYSYLKFGGSNGVDLVAPINHGS